MALPEPQPGLIIRYDYLWRREAALGRDQSKDRPACLIAATDRTVHPRFVVILPITHTPPSEETVGVEIPSRVRQFLGLGDVSCWVIVSEHNTDEWPNAGLRPLPGHPGVFSYGFVPPRLFAQIKAKFLELRENRGDAGVRR